MNDDQRRVLLNLEAWHSPLVLNPGGWDEDLPAYIQSRVVAERIAMIDNGGWNEATDAEVTAHLFTASLANPISSDWAQIYEHEVSLLIPQIVDVLPSAGNPLTDSQERELKELKYKIRQRQIKEWKIKSKEEHMKRRLVMEEVESTGKVLVGVMKGDYDPITKSFDGTIETVLPLVPEFIITAEEKWKTDPKFPKYVAPEPPKANPKPANKVVGNGGRKPTEDLPLLAGSKEKPPDKPEEELPLVTSAQPPVTPEEKPSEVTAGLQAAAGVNAEPVPPPDTITAADVEPHKVEPAKDEHPAPPATPPGSPVSAEKPEFEYYLKDGRGPFDNVQLAMDAMGIDKDKRPTHNRWDRLSTALKEAIPRRIKGSGTKEETPLLKS